MTRFVDYRKRDDGRALYVRLNYWQGTLNVWRAFHEEDGSISAENVSDWRGLRHINVKREDFEQVTMEEAYSAMDEGLKLARRNHRNEMRRTLEARRDGASDGHSAGTWVIDGNTSTETARRILDEMAACEFELHGETNYSQKYADDDEKWTAYVEAYDSAYDAEVYRAASYLVNGASE